MRIMPRPPLPQLDLDRQLCFPLYAASRAVVRAYGPLLDHVGLTYPQYIAMVALWDNRGDPVTVGELGRRLRLDTGTLTPLLKRLESLGHITRRRDVEDERRVLLEVTDAGWALRDRVAHVPSDLFASTEMSSADAAELRRLLNDLLARLDS
jgi:MarR family transcriptional regulator, organic hydroperoxide resistance regulator